MNATSTTTVDSDTGFSGVALYPQVSGGNNEVFWYTTGTGSAGDVVTYTEMGTNANVINTSVGGVYKT